jgi:hypothetical protein
VLLTTGNLDRGLSREVEQAWLNSHHRAEPRNRPKSLPGPARASPDTAFEYGEQALARTGEAARAARDTALEHPIATIAVFAGLAFAIGALWKISNSRQQTSYDRLLHHLTDLRGQLPRNWR